MQPERVIYHIDCNSFYASVECMLKPELRLVPMAVAGDPKDRCGIILAKNEKARACGVKTAETIHQAQRKCPGLVLVEPHHRLYVEVSRAVKHIFAQYTDQVESFGLDEAWLDVTGSLRYFHTTPVELADEIRQRVKKEIGITVSVGVSYNKAFAKLGSDLKKPDAVTLITRDNYRRRVWPLPVEDLLFVGKTVSAQLRRHYITTIGDIACSEVGFLQQLLGKGGETLWFFANGLDSSPVCRIGEEEPAKSIGNGMTFRRDLMGWEELKAGVMALSDEVAMRLREEEMRCCVLQIMVRNPSMKTISRQGRMAAPTCLQKEIVDRAMELLHENWREDEPVRALSVTAQQLLPKQEVLEQPNILVHSSAALEKFERAEKAMQKLRSKYGRDCLAMGFVQNEELGIGHPEKKAFPSFVHDAGQKGRF